MAQSLKLSINYGLCYNIPNDGILEDNSITHIHIQLHMIVFQVCWIHFKEIQTILYLTVVSFSHNSTTLKNATKL